MSRESAFSSMDNSAMNTALNDYFGGVMRPEDPVDLMKENDERTEYNERLLESTGAVAAPFIEKGLHGAVHKTFQGFRKIAGRTGQKAIQELGTRAGLSEQTIQDLKEGKINLTKLSKEGLDGLVRSGNVNTGRMLDQDLKLRSVDSKLPLDVKLEDASSTGIKLPRDIQAKYNVSGKVRNDDLGSVSIPEEWSPGKAPNMSVRNQKELLRQQRRMAKNAAKTGESYLDKESQQARIQGKIDRMRTRRTKGSIDSQIQDPIKQAQVKADSIQTTIDNPFDIRVYDSAEATAARNELDRQISKDSAEQALAKAIKENAAKAKVAIPELPDFAGLDVVKTDGLPSLAGKSKLPSGPIKQGSKGFAKQQIKILEGSTIPEEKIHVPEINVKPTINIASQEEPGAPAENKGVRVGGKILSDEPSGALVRKEVDPIKTSAETEGGDVSSTSINTALKDPIGQAAVKATGKDVSEDLGKTAADAVEAAATTEAELGGPEDPLADILSLGVGLGTMFGGLGNIKHQALPTYRRPVNPSVVYGI